MFMFEVPFAIPQKQSTSVDCNFTCLYLPIYLDCWDFKNTNMKQILTSTKTALMYVDSIPTLGRRKGLAWSPGMIQYRCKVLTIWQWMIPCGCQSLVILIQQCQRCIGCNLLCNSYLLKYEMFCFSWHTSQIHRKFHPAKLTSLFLKAIKHERMWNYLNIWF